MKSLLAVGAFYASSIGKKLIVAITGLALLGFLFGHMVGNLKIFLGPEKINSYAAWLHSMPGMLWAARLGLLAAFGRPCGDNDSAGDPEPCCAG